MSGRRGEGKRLLVRKVKKGREREKVGETWKGKKTIKKKYKRDMI
jgi:hypothetical protein